MSTAQLLHTTSRPAFAAGPRLAPNVNPAGFAPTILVADDDDAIRDLIAFKLQMADYHVVTADNGTTALHVVEQQLPAAVILDISMPGLDGLDVCYRMQALRATVDIPVIMISASGRHDDISLATTIGADDYLVKPFNPGELVRRVRWLLLAND
jgi:DNA-binding response OmpR family regulator